MVAEGGNIDIVRYLVDKGAAINIKDNNGVSIPLRVNWYCQLDFRDYYSSF